MIYITLKNLYTLCLLIIKKLINIINKKKFHQIDETFFYSGIAFHF